MCYHTKFIVPNHPFVQFGRINMTKTSSEWLFFPQSPNAMLSQGRKKGPRRRALPLKAGLFISVEPLRR